MNLWGKIKKTFDGNQGLPRVLSILLFAGLATALLLIVRAAGPYVAAEGEQASAIGVIIGNDANASGGQYIEFTGVSQPGGVTSLVYADAYNTGGANVGFYDTTTANLGSGTCRSDAVDLKPGSDDHCTVGWFATGEWLKYDVSIATAGTYTVTFNVAKGDAGTGKLHLEQGATNITGNIDVPSNGDWNQVVAITDTVTLAAGDHTLRLVSDLQYFDIASMQFNGPGAVTMKQAGGGGDDDDPPTGGTWVPPTSAVVVPYTWPTPDVTLNPGDNIRDAYNSGKRKIKLNPGSYGSQTLGSMPDTYVWSATYKGATFANGSGPFVTPAKNMIIGGLKVENYGMHDTTEGGAMLNFNGVNNQWAINMAVGKSTNNGYSVKGTFSGIRGGEIYEISRYAWAGGGTDNTFEDIYVKTIGTTTLSTNRGVTKTVFSQRHTIRRISGFDVRWNGIWFDIQNQPALIEDLYFDGITRAAVFIEVSYGGENQTGEWKLWRVNRVGGKNISPTVRESEVNWPVPAAVQISSTSDIIIDGVYGTGWRIGVSLLNDPNHPQITGAIGTYDRSRAGLQNITIKNQNTPGTIYAVAAVAGTAATAYPEMKDPTGLKWIDPIWPSGSKFRDISGIVTQAAFEAKYVD